MYIESVPNRNSPPAILVRESFRDEQGKVKKRTLANISDWDPVVIAGLKVLLKGGQASTVPLAEQFEIQRSLPHGHVAAVLGTLFQTGLHTVIDRRDSRERSLCLALIVSRILDPGSKLALSRQLNPATATSTLGGELGLGEVDEQEIYRAMRWLLDRQDAIEKRLAKAGLGEGSTVLYDLTSTYYEGSKCVLAARGHNRDGKSGKRQINFGLLTDSQGCPVAIEAFTGNTADPATVGHQLKTLRGKFGLEKVILVGDRGMLTSARIEALRTDATLDQFAWISALRSGQVRKIAAAGHLQAELFDETDLAEITSEEDFPGERLVVCRNPALATERTRKRNELLEVTEKNLTEIAAACRRTRAPLKGQANIARRVENAAAKYKMLKHFELEISETTLMWKRRETEIAEEAALDGYYIVRAGRVSAEEMDADGLVRTYKSLSGVERAFRGIKTTSLHVRPIFHREEDMVRAHLLVCMLAWRLRWQLEARLKPVLFNDEEPGGAPRKSPVAKARRSASGSQKAATRQMNSASSLPVHSFATLMSDLGTLTRNTLRPNIPGAPANIYKLTEPTANQTQAFELLNIIPKALPACSQ